MNDTRFVLGAVAGVVSLLAFIPYLSEVLRGEARPNRTSWWIWTVSSGILCVSYYASGARSSIWVPFVYAIACLVVAVVSLRRGEGGFSRFDRGCAAASLVGLVLWWLSGSPLTALAINICVDFAGALPTIRKTYRDPRSESLLAWGLFLVANVLNLLAVESWRSFGVALPLCYFTTSAVLSALLLRRWAPSSARRG